MAKFGDWLLNAVYYAMVTFAIAIGSVIVLIWLAALTKLCIKYLLGVN